MTDKKKHGCGDPSCGASTGICESLTFGSGELDDNGYWEKPCAPCARDHERLHPEDGRCWPFEGQPGPDGLPRPRANVRCHFLTRQAAEAFIEGVEFVTNRGTEQSLFTTLGVKEIKTGWLALLIDRNRQDDQLHQPGQEVVFESPFQQYRDRNNQFCTVRRIINLPDEQHDEEVLPMYVVRFRDGREMEVWPEELHEKSDPGNEDRHETRSAF